MQKRNSIVNIPLVGGVVLSIAVHATALYSRGIYTPAEPQLDAGRTVVKLTLIPSMASQAAPPEPIVEPEPVQEPQPEPELIVVPVAPIPASLPDPTPEPIVKKEVEPESEAIVDPIPEQVESKEQIGTIIEDKGVITDARPANGIVASYPRISQRRGEEGTVVLSIQVMQNGRAGKVSIIESSGSKRLDEAAIKAAKKSTYKPAEQFGRPIESTLIQPLTFKLTQQ